MLSLIIRFLVAIYLRAVAAERDTDLSLNSTFSDQFQSLLIS